MCRFSAHESRNGPRRHELEVSDSRSPGANGTHASSRLNRCGRVRNPVSARRRHEAFAARCSDPIVTAFVHPKTWIIREVLAMGAVGAFTALNPAFIMFA